MNKNCCEKCNPVIPGVLGMQMGFCKDEDCNCHKDLCANCGFAIKLVSVNDDKRYCSVGCLMNDI